MLKKTIHFIFSIFIIISSLQNIFSCEEIESDIEQYHVIKLEPRSSLSFKQYHFTERSSEFRNKKKQINPDCSNIKKDSLKSAILNKTDLKQALKYTSELSVKCLLISGCLITDSLTQYYINDINPVGLSIVAANSMFSAVIAQYLGNDLGTKINQVLLITGLIIEPKITIASYVLNFMLSKTLGEQTAASLLSCVAADNAIHRLLGQNKSQYFINASMVLATSNTLMPGIVEQTLGTSYKEKFSQAVFVAGMCLAPEITIGAYAMSYILDELAGI